MCVHANTAESDRYAGKISIVLAGKAQTCNSSVQMSGQLTPTLTSSCIGGDRVSHITSAFLIMLPECNIRSSLSSHLHSFIHSSHFFFFLKDILASFSLFSHTFPASSCSPFLFLSSVLIEIQLCNSLSEDTIDLSPSCVFEEHRQEEKDSGKRDGWTETERGREEQEAGRERAKGVKKKLGLGG